MKEISKLFPMKSLGATLDDPLDGINQRSFGWFVNFRLKFRSLWSLTNQAPDPHKAIKIPKAITQPRGINGGLAVSAGWRGAGGITGAAGRDSGVAVPGRRE